MHGHEVRAGQSRRAGGAANLMRYIVELKVEKYLEAALFEFADDGGALGVVQGHTHLEPPCVTLELISKLDSAIPTAVDGDDNPIASERL